MLPESRSFTLVKDKIEEKIITEFASLAHEAWRKGFDSVYAETGVPSKQRVKKNSDGTEADINVPFGNLHPDWQKENLAAGKAALQALQQFPTAAELDKAANFIHEEWMKRNPKADYNAAQHVPYAELPEVEKEKDRVQVVTINEIMVKNVANNISQIRTASIEESSNNSPKLK